MRAKPSLDEPSSQVYQLEPISSVFDVSSYNYIP